MQAAGAVVHSEMMPCQVVFRCDASLEIGTGHVMRCLALADILRQSGASVSFLCRELEGDLRELIEKEHFAVHRLRAPAAANCGADWISDAEQVRVFLGTLAQSCDWLVVDHYGLGREWEECMRPHVGQIMVIDDLGSRPHDCDLYLDQNLQRSPEHSHRGTLPARCRILLGPRHALLRPEFHEARSRLDPRDGSVRRILVFFGGTDLPNQTGKALEAIGQLGSRELAVDVIVGGNNPHCRKLRSICESVANLSFHGQVKDMAKRMTAADLSIGAGGITTWERCFLGLPSITISIAPNQEGPLQNAAAGGCVVYLGTGESVSVRELRDALEALLDDPARLCEMSRRCLDVTRRPQGRDEVVHHLLQATHA